MAMDGPNPDYTQHIDTAAGTLTTKERRYLRWTPKWGGRWTVIEAAIVAAIAVGIAAVIVVWVL
jgi:hypothetical protein